MRKTRSRKFRNKNHILSISLKITLVCYLIALSASYITSNTSAHFSDQKKVSQMITAGTWEEDEPKERKDSDAEVDDSSLAFLTNDNEPIEACEPHSIEVEIINDGEGDMQEDGTYEVYYAETGDPEKQGDRVDLEEEEGIIGALKNGESAKLTVEVSKPGFYAFVMHQSDGHPNTKGIWSDTFTVTCQVEDGPDPVENEDHDVDAGGTENRDDNIEDEGTKENQENKDDVIDENHSKDAQKDEDIPSVDPDEPDGSSGLEKGESQ